MAASPGPERLSRALAELIARRGYARVRAAGQLQSAWAEIAGVTIARQTRVGTFGVNVYEPDIGSPWGGRGPSGSGSAYGPEGMDAYLTSKSVFLPSFRASAESHASDT